MTQADTTEAVKITPGLWVPTQEITLQAIRAQGAGGQNVNKVSTAIHLRFDIAGSSLPQAVKEKLLALSDQRISSEGVIVIKAQQFRSQEKNREDALARLAELIRQSMVTRKARKATRPSKGAQQRRLDSKTRHSQKKMRRTRVEF